MKSKIQKLFDDYNIKNISFDSRNTKKNDVFFAIKGSNFDGNDYIDLAISNGANLIFTDDANKKIEGTKIVYMENIRQALSIAAEIFYPRLPKYLLAVTGTNGKTSIVNYVNQIFELLNVASASIGTLGVKCVNKELEKKFKQDDNLTTADTVTLRKNLHLLAQNNINHVALEASSHGLDQQRLYGLSMHAAAFSSFSQDHLDYHRSMEQYLAAKLRLFTDNLSSDKTVILNGEISNLNEIKNYLLRYNKNILTISKYGDIQILDIHSSLYLQKVSFIYLEKKWEFKTSIIGSFQLYNLLIAALLVETCNIEFSQILKVIAKVQAAPGRLERVTELNNSYQIFVDYAHTPEALEKSLLELRKIKQVDKGKLKLVFGCGGERDKIKRSVMGHIAASLADEIIVTDDNPRNEDAELIRKQILEGAIGAMEIAGREKAIELAVKGLDEHDILLIAGKGHESYQIINNTKYPFSDILIAKKNILEKI